MRLTLLESGRRGNPAPASNPRGFTENAYAAFVARYADSHPGLRGPALFRAAAKAYRGGGTMATKKRRSRRHNPDTAANPRRRRRRHNPDTAANPRRHRSHRRTRRNPLGVTRTTRQVWGVSPEEMLAGAVNFVVVAAAGSKINEMLPEGLKRPNPGPSVVDPVYALLKALPTGLAAFGTHWLAKRFGLDSGIVKAIAATGGAATATQGVAALHILPPGILQDGSVIVGHPAPIPMPQIAPPAGLPVLPPQQAIIIRTP